MKKIETRKEYFELLDKFLAETIELITQKEKELGKINDDQSDDQLLNRYNFGYLNNSFNNWGLDEFQSSDLETITPLTARDIAQKILLYIEKRTTPQMRGMNHNRVSSLGNDDFQDWLYQNITVKANGNVKEIVNDELGGVIHLLVMLLKEYWVDWNVNINRSLNDNGFMVNKYLNQAIVFLLNAGIDPNLKNGLGHTIVETAILSGFYSFITNDLISKSKEKKLDVNTKDNLGNSIVHTAISCPSYNENIVELIKALGEDFDINTRNNDGKDIIDYLNYCIENEQVYAELGYTTYSEIENHINNLKAQKNQIIEHIKLKRNPIDSANRATLIRKINELKNLEISIASLRNFMGLENVVVPIDYETITLEETAQLIKNKSNTQEYLKQQLYESLYPYFGVNTDLVVSLIISKSFTFNSLTPMDFSSFIKACGLSLGYTKKYPGDKTKNNVPNADDAIKWLKEALNYHKKIHTPNTEIGKSYKR